MINPLELIYQHYSWIGCLWFLDRFSSNERALVELFGDFRNNLRDHFFSLNFLRRLILKRSRFLSLCLLLDNLPLLLSVVFGFEHLFSIFHLLLHHLILFILLLLDEFGLRALLCLVHKLFHPQLFFFFAKPSSLLLCGCIEFSVGETIVI